MDTLRHGFIEKPRKIRRYPRCDSFLMRYFLKIMRENARMP